jgi:hypothetical protein
MSDLAPELANMKREPAGLHVALTMLIDRLDLGRFNTSCVIRWSAPVPVFGDLLRSSVATLGINPSNREFVDSNGEELEGTQRRFHTLNSLGIDSWAEADSGHLTRILDTCLCYFGGNPYNLWFKKLDYVLSGTGVSYYSSPGSACHLDLVPLATEQKWGEIGAGEQRSLLGGVARILALVLRDSQIKVLVLNGSTAVGGFERTSGVVLEKREMPSWDLVRGPGRRDVGGRAFRGEVRELDGVPLNRRLLVLGFNHNIQSSFGMNGSVARAIRDWVAQEWREFGHEAS